MTVLKRFAIFVAAVIIVIGGSEIGKSLSIFGEYSLISTAEARVGRPLTPVSVGGVARRSTRRHCAAGVTRC